MAPRSTPSQKSDKPDKTPIKSSGLGDFIIRLFDVITLPGLLPEGLLQVTKNTSNGVTIYTAGVEIGGFSTTGGTLNPSEVKIDIVAIPADGVVNHPALPPATTITGPLNNASLAVLVPGTPAEGGKFYVRVWHKYSFDTTHPRYLLTAVPVIAHIVNP